jgi:hypothetical protein
MNIEEYKKIADNEIDNPQWKLTKQYLETNKIEKVNKKYVYERYSIHRKKDMDVITFYYKIKNYHYFFGVEVNIEKKEIEWVFMRNSTYCYLSATSENMTLAEMANLTKLKYSFGATKGQKGLRGKNEFINDNSWVEYKFLKETSFEIEEALNLLLDELENDKEGIKALASKTDAVIVFCKYQYVSANAGIELDIKTIARLKELNLGIFIDMYCEGEYFK